MTRDLEAFHEQNTKTWALKAQEQGRRTNKSELQKPYWSAN